MTLLNRRIWNVSVLIPKYTLNVHHSHKWRCRLIAFPEKKKKTLYSCNFNSLQKLNFHSLNSLLILCMSLILLGKCLTKFELSRCLWLKLRHTCKAKTVMDVKEECDKCAGKWLNAFMLLSKLALEGLNCHVVSGSWRKWRWVEKHLWGN